MRPYLSALVISASLVSTGSLAQLNQPQAGAGQSGIVAPIDPSEAGSMPSGFAAGKPYVNKYVQHNNNAMQQEVQKLIESGKINNPAAEPSTPVEGAATEDAPKSDFKELNRLSQSLADESVSNMQMQKNAEGKDGKKQPEAPDPITNLSPSMRKSANDDTAITAELIDGQYVVFRDNGYVTIMNERGRAITPPDGVMTLKDGTTFNIKDGMRTE